MRTTVTIDDELIARAAALTGISERSTLVRRAFEALVQQESARRLALLGGSDPSAAAAPRARPDVA
ncbi:type II toxin-antitoxin system VapB family antitoxin [Microbacterium thalassium]|uniref:Arc/MetJ family transcription regulator n=1 Tax=Microbacterium thalassium TaxID=362649 RepID=A0A7X0FS66_9MICO|nr:type II toxin-antitoxin system VapB family antitoxin [Microbacterium thalassium]MBB6392742.1 Arc/MetJ family transcription regulator [Microbacterium thalassium]GLK23026.1 hypothetical protein GCM10017607_03440 [Microbacterium thalassium]